ncbi:hypothetical protein GAR05_05168 [Micromonospora saelicesensis]|uniref:Uncharacterized protein n=1 Tax=Micromonospora saelicesensis TaxID=285676 RepID=A0ABX9CC66_9ACTN|nr:hypothetical protein GAR05_05168 [Micromonospora saelicesensis]
MKKWREGASGGLAAYVRDGGQNDKARRKAREEWMHRAEQRERLNLVRALKKVRPLQMRRWNRKLQRQKVPC